MIHNIDPFVMTPSQPEACLAFYERLGFYPKKTVGRYEVPAGNFVEFCCYE